MRIFLATLLSLSTGVFAQAQGTWTLGGLGLFGPSYSGGPVDQFTLVPLIQYETGPWTFGGRNLVNYEFAGAGPFAADLGLGFDMGQDDPAAPQVDLAGTVYGKLAYRHPFFEVSSTLTSRLFSNDPGTSLKLELASGYPLADKLFLAGSVSQTYADSDYMQSYYALNGDGLEKTELSVQAIYSLTEAWTLSGGVTFGRLSDDIAAQAFVTDRSSTTFNLGISRKL